MIFAPIVLLCRVIEAGLIRLGNGLEAAFDRFDPDWRNRSEF